MDQILPLDCLERAVLTVEKLVVAVLALEVDWVGMHREVEDSEELADSRLQQRGNLMELVG